MGPAAQFSLETVHCALCSRWKQLGFSKDGRAHPPDPTELCGRLPLDSALVSLSSCVTGFHWDGCRRRRFWEQGDRHVMQRGSQTSHLWNPADKHSSISLVLDDNVAVFTRCYITLHLIYKRRRTLPLWKQCNESNMDSSCQCVLLF